MAAQRWACDLSALLCVCHRKYKALTCQMHAAQATVYIYELIDDEVKVDKVEFSKEG